MKFTKILVTLFASMILGAGMLACGGGEGDEAYDTSEGAAYYVPVKTTGGHNPACGRMQCMIDGVATTKDCKDTELQVNCDAPSCSNHVAVCGAGNWAL